MKQTVLENLSERTRHLETLEIPDIGDGPPTYEAAEGTFYWDYTNDDLYVNDDGADGWTLIGGASAAAYHNLLSATHSDTYAEAVLEEYVIAGQVTADGLRWAREATTGGQVADSVVRTNASSGINPIWLSVGTGAAVPSGLAQAYINQASATGSIPVIRLDQDDSDEGFIYFDGTAGAGYALVNISTTQGDGAVVGPKAPSTVDGWIFSKMVKVQTDDAETTYWLAVYEEDPV